MSIKRCCPFLEYPFSHLYFVILIFIALSPWPSHSSFCCSLSGIINLHQPGWDGWGMCIPLENTLNISNNFKPSLLPTLGSEITPRLKILGKEVPVPRFPALCLPSLAKIIMKKTGIYWNTACRCQDTIISITCCLERMKDTWIWWIWWVW